jgi:hypothetical protein
MAVVVVTRLEARGLRGARAVAGRTEQVLSDCRAVEGFLGARLHADRHLVFWTVTLWRDRAALAAFGARHAQVAASLDDVARASALTAWQTDDDAVPTFAEVARRWTDVPPPARGLGRSVPAPGHRRPRAEAPAQR